MLVGKKLKNKLKEQGMYTKFQPIDLLNCFVLEHNFYYKLTGQFMREP